MIRLSALRRSPPNSVLVRCTSGQSAAPKMSSHNLRQKSRVSSLERMGWLCEQVWKQLNSVQLWQYQALAPLPSCSANSALERQQAPQSTGETALMTGQTSLSSSSRFLPLSEAQKASRRPYCTWNTMASDQQNMNSRVLSFSAPNMAWKTSRLSLRLCCSAYSVTVRMASTQQAPLRLAERKICSSKSRKSSTASTTALEAMAPTVRCGYLARNQAESAPGYEPPMVTQGFAVEMPCHLFLLSSSMKKARSLSACLELSSRRFSLLKDCARKGSDSPQKRCSSARTSALVSLASWAVQDWSETPLQMPSPQMQSSTGPLLGSKQVSVTQQRCFQNCGGRQLKWSRIWSKSCTFWLRRSAGCSWRKGLLKRQQLVRRASRARSSERMLQIIIKQDQSWSMPSASSRLSLGLRSRRGRSSISMLMISSSILESCLGCSATPQSSFSSASCSGEMASLALKACSSHLRRLSSYFSPQMQPHTLASSRRFPSLAVLSCSAQAFSHTPLKRCSTSRLAALKACLLFLSIWSSSSSAQQLRCSATALTRSQASLLNYSLSMNLRKVSVARITTFSSFSTGSFETSIDRYSCIFSSASPTSTGAQTALIILQALTPSMRPALQLRTERHLLSQHTHAQTQPFADHDALEQHRRNIIVDFQQKVQEIKQMRDKIAAFPHRKSLYLGYKASSHREKREVAENQRAIAAGSEGRKVGVSNISLGCLFLKEEEQARLTPFQKDSMSRMKAKKELMLRKSGKTALQSSPYRRRAVRQGLRLQTE